MTLDDIAHLIETLERGPMTELAYGEGPFSLTLKKGAPAPAAPSVAPATAAQPAASPDKLIKSPGLGILRLAHPARERGPRPGDTVAAGEAVAFLEVGAVLTAIVAPEAGTITKVLGEDGAVIGYAAPVYAWR